MPFLLLAHCRQRCSYTVIGPHEVDVYHILHLIPGKCVDRATLTNTGASYNQVNATKLLNCFMHQCLYLLFIADVCEHAYYIARSSCCCMLAYLLLSLLQLWLLNIRQDNVRAFSVQGCGCRQSDSTRSAGDYCNCLRKVCQCHVIRLLSNTSKDLHIKYTV